MTTLKDVSRQTGREAKRLLILRPIYALIFQTKRLAGPLPRPGITNTVWRLLKP